MPATWASISSAGTPRSAASSPVVCWTEWQSPTVRIGLASATAQQSIAIGLTYCSSSASGHSASMSRQTSSRTGIVRSARLMPPTPSVSPIVWRSPWRLGTSKSTSVDSSPPTWKLVTT